MVIKLMHDNFDSTTLEMIKKRINQFMCDLVVFPETGGVRMMNRLILKFNNRPKYGAQGLISDLSLQVEMMKAKVFPNTNENDERFTFELAYPDQPSDPMCMEFTIKLS